MEFEWDENKNKANLKKHDISFEVASEIFQSLTLTSEISTHEYGEQRHISIGIVEDIVITVIHTKRGEKTRIISARKASKKERNIYHDHITQRTATTTEK